MDTILDIWPLSDLDSCLAQFQNLINLSNGHNDSV